MCRLLVTIPGVGPVVSLAFTSTIDIPQRFRNSKAVGPILGLTPKLKNKRVGCISLCGDVAGQWPEIEKPRIRLARLRAAEIQDGLVHPHDRHRPRQDEDRMANLAYNLTRFVWH